MIKKVKKKFSLDSYDFSYINALHFSSKTVQVHNVNMVSHDTTQSHILNIEYSLQAQIQHQHLPAQSVDSEANLSARAAMILYTRTSLKNGSLLLLGNLRRYIY